MLDALIAWDDRAFRFINGAGQHPALDVLLPLISDVTNFLLPIAALTLVLLVWGGPRGRRFVLVAVTSVLMADAVNTHLFKHTILRARPCTVLEGVQLLVGCANTPSFPSNHAANMGAFATIVALNARLFLIPAAAAAMLVAYSRVYVGVHYPLDVLVGSLLGVAMGLAFCWVTTSLLGPLPPWPARGSPTPPRRIEADDT